LLTLLRREVIAAEEQQAVYTQVYRASMARASQAKDPRAFFLSMLTLDYGLKSSQTMLAWLKNAIVQIESKTYTPSHF
jgi:CII-binding regulator of phage lambda lysogenization HflD